MKDAQDSLRATAACRHETLSSPCVFKTCQLFFPQVVLVFNSCLIYVLIMGLDMMCNTVLKRVLP